MALLTGFALALLAGVTIGFSGWSIKRVRVWKWENFWLVYAVVSLIIAPTALAYVLLPHLNQVYGSLTPHEILLPFGMGLLWGFAQLGAGVTLYRLGLAVSTAVLNGIGVAVGTLMPLLMLHRNLLLQKSGLLILFGVAVTVTGVALCGWSGYRRERQAKVQGRGAGFSSTESAMAQTGSTPRQYLLYLAIAVISGVLSSLLNIALAYSTGILDKVGALGGRPAWAPFAIWPIALLGGSVVNIAYSVYLLAKNKSWGHFGDKFGEIVYPTLMALMWMGGIALYSSATTFLGVLGVSIGFALFTITMIISSQSAAVITGEWRLMERNIYRSFYLGIVLLVLAVITIGTANYYQR
jgi:L-rhamnose-H+ transport protein